MLNGLNNIVNFLNGYIWGVGMLVLIVGSGLYFTIRLHGFQFVHFKDMWSRIIDKQDSDSGISAFGSFCFFSTDYGTGGNDRHGKYRRRGYCHGAGRTGSIVLDDPCRYDELSSMLRRVYTGSSV